jgi:hypothetical protein
VVVEPPGCPPPDEQAANQPEAARSAAAAKLGGIGLSMGRLMLGAAGVRSQAVQDRKVVIGQPLR